MGANDMRIALLGFVLALTCAGCFPRSRIGWFDAHAFYPTRQHYRIRERGKQPAQVSARTKPRSAIRMSWLRIRTRTPGRS